MYYCTISYMPVVGNTAIRTEGQSSAYTVNDYDSLEKGMKALLSLALPNSLTVLAIHNEEEELLCSFSALHQDKKGFKYLYLDGNATEHVFAESVDHAAVLLAMRVGNDLPAN